MKGGKSIHNTLSYFSENPELSLTQKQKCKANASLIVWDELLMASAICPSAAARQLRNLIKENVSIGEKRCWAIDWKFQTDLTSCIAF